MKEIRIGSCGDDNGFFVDVKTNGYIKCAFDLTQMCYSNCAACSVVGTGCKAFCNRGVKDDFCIGYVKLE